MIIQAVLLPASVRSCCFPSQTVQAVTAVMTMMPPIRAKTPGVSPSKIITQTGFRSGSAALRRLQARGGQVSVALTYRMYGIPS